RRRSHVIGRRVDGVALRRWVVGAVAGSGLLAGGPVLALVAGAGAASVVPIAARLHRRRSQAAVEAAVPDLVDLFLVSASAGQPVAGSLAVVAPRAPASVAPAVTGAHERFRRGLPLAECLTGLGGELGTAGVPLTDALRQAAATGVPLVPLLSGVAASARDARRRRAQEVARRLPVTMLFPLVACILPAAVALAVVPVLLVSVSSLSP
ncbi:MAG: gspF, partial [Ilumatobacteraceae bacterium]|nr:gspF [Ilumatobacteraceae bacterium]